MSQSVIKVPNDSLELFLEEEFASSIRIEDESCCGWEVPTQGVLNSLKYLITTRMKSNRVSLGCRVGTDHRGAFLQENHLKRYFGIPRDHAPVLLSSRFPDAVAVTAKMKSPSSYMQGDTVEEMLGSLMISLPAVSKTARERVLRSTFQRLDQDGSGTLSRSEVFAMIRRLNPRVSGQMVTDIMEHVDKDKSETVQYEEFLAWLMSHDPRAKADNKKIGVDTIHASFRIWDDNGDGLITKREMGKVMKEVCPNITTEQLRTLWLHLDQNGDNRVDYEEFIDFVFPD